MNSGLNKYVFRQCEADGTAVVGGKKPMSMSDVSAFANVVYWENDPKLAETICMLFSLGNSWIETVIVNGKVDSG